MKRQCSLPILPFIYDATTYFYNSLFLKPPRVCHLSGLYFWNFGLQCICRLISPPLKAMSRILVIMCGSWSQNPVSSLRHSLPILLNVQRSQWLTTTATLRMFNIHHFGNIFGNMFWCSNEGKLNSLPIDNFIRSQYTEKQCPNALIWWQSQDGSTLDNVWGVKMCTKYSQELLLYYCTQ